MPQQVRFYDQLTHDPGLVGGRTIRQAAILSVGGLLIFVQLLIFELSIATILWAFLTLIFFVFWAFFVYRGYHLGHLWWYRRKYKKRKRRYIWTVDSSNGEMSQLQKLVEIEAIYQNAFKLANSPTWGRIVAPTELVNFDQLPTELQISVANAWEEMVTTPNDFGFDVVNQTREGDISEYIHNLETGAETEFDERVAFYALDHAALARRVTKDADLRETVAYFVVTADEPFLPVGIFGWLYQLLLHRKVAMFNPKAEAFRQLNKRSDYVINGLISMGLDSRVIEGREIPSVLRRFWTSSDEEPEDWETDPSPIAFIERIPTRVEVTEISKNKSLVRV